MLNLTHYIKEIGRGKDGARDMSEQEAYELFGAILDGDPQAAGVQPDAPLAYQPGDLLAFDTGPFERGRVTPQSFP